MIRCPVCRGDGVSPEVHATGEMFDGDVCPLCGGSGQVQEP